jgi:hypothetical protein
MMKVLHVVLPKEDVKSCKFHSAFGKKIRSSDAPAQSRPIYQLEGIYRAVCKLIMKAKEKYGN